MRAAAVLPTTSRKVTSILLVDDQSFVGMALTRLLAEETDLELHCCLDAESAVPFANAIVPALILQDLVMPTLDGLTLVRMFRENPATARIPVIVLSANHDAESRRRALASGASDYLVKLPPQAELVACLRRHLAGHAAAADLQPQPVANNDALDLSVIAEFRRSIGEDDTGFVPMLIAQFIQELAAQLAVLDAGVRNSDGAALKATGHSLKGGAATIGATPLAALCGRLEDDLSRSGGRVSAITVEFIAAIRKEAVRVRVACARERGQIGSGS